MNQYIFILMWVLALGFFYKLKRQQDRGLYDEEIYKYPARLYCIILVLPIIISAALRTTFGDQGYKISYRVLDLNFSELIEIIKNGEKGPGYTVITYLGTKILGIMQRCFFSL